MSCYGPLAPWYDRLTGDVPYERFADLYETEFARCGGEFRLLLDLCCGTGTLTALMARRGYELIGVDASADMLMAARDKCAELPVPPLLICQEAAALDLYGTVDAAYCSLEGMNYLPGAELPALFSRLRLFIRPGGLFLFDLRTPDWLRAQDGQINVDETEELLCLWRAEFDESVPGLRYGMDLFQRRGESWLRSGEEHLEYAHEPQALTALLEQAGFGELRTAAPLPPELSERLFIIAKRLEDPHG